MLDTAKSEPAPYVSVNETAAALGVHRDTVLRMVARHELESEQIAGRTVIVRASLDRALAARPQ